MNFQRFDSVFRMTKRALFSRRRTWPVLFLTSLAATGCGLESLLVDFVANDPELPSIASGLTVLVTVEGFGGAPSFHAFDLAGNEITLESVQPVDNEAAFLLAFPSSASGQSVRISAAGGNKVVKAILPRLELETESDPLTLELSAATTAATLVAETVGAVHRADDSGGFDYWSTSYALAAVATDELELIYDSHILGGNEAGDADIVTFIQSVSAIIAAGDEGSVGTPMFPLAASDINVVNAAFFDENVVDTDGDGAADTVDSTLTQAMALAKDSLDRIDAEIGPAIYTDPETGEQHPWLRVIFTAHVNAGVEDGNCTSFDKCQGGTIACDGGDTLFFTGGIFTADDVIDPSPILDPDVDAALSSFIPNILPMRDDGTGGDEVAGDGIFTLTFRLPETLRISYKLTWGTYGQTWTGTEEWPGFNRLLEVRDINSDGYVWRDDRIGDEAFNKEQRNCYNDTSCYQKIESWDADLNGDGYAETRENPLAASLDASNWLATPTGKCIINNNTVSWIRATRVPRATAGNSESFWQGTIAYSTN